MYGFLIRMFRALDYWNWFSIFEMRDLAIYAEYQKLLGLNWKDSKRILKNIYRKIDEGQFKTMEDFRGTLTAEERRVFNCFSSPESTYIRECVRFLTEDINYESEDSEICPEA